MKSFIISLCITISLLAIIPLMAEEKPVNDKGVFTLQIGTGLGVHTVAWASYSSLYSQGFYAVPPIIVSGNFGIIDLVSAGFIIGYEGWGVSNSYIKYNINYFMIGARGDFHFNRWIKVKRLDVYAGVIMGVNIINESGNLMANPFFNTSVNATTAGFLWNVQAGVRWYFHENVGLWAEAGYGYSIISGGIIFKF